MNERTYENVTVRREAGAVTRWHLVPHHGQDTVGHHSWNATMLLLELNPTASRALIVYMLNHDVAERWSGDIPASAKGMFSTIAQGVRECEEWLQHKFNLPGANNLTKDEQHWARAIDALESALWCEEQKAMGNRNVETALASLTTWLMNEGCVPAAVQVFCLDYKWKRTMDYVTEGKHYGNNE